jgi:hypothetical protein
MGAMMLEIWFDVDPKSARALYGGKANFKRFTDALLLFTCLRTGSAVRDLYLPLWWVGTDMHGFHCFR